MGKSLIELLSHVTKSCGACNKVGMLIRPNASHSLSQKHAQNAQRSVLDGCAAPLMVLMGNSWLTPIVILKNTRQRLQETSLLLRGETVTKLIYLPFFRKSLNRQSPIQLSVTTVHVTAKALQ